MRDLSRTGVIDRDRPCWPKTLGLDWLITQEWLMLSMACIGASSLRFLARPMLAASRWGSIVVE